jgi:hypothetical protein
MASLSGSSGPRPASLSKAVPDEEVVPVSVRVLPCEVTVGR